MVLKFKQFFEFCQDENKNTAYSDSCCAFKNSKKDDMACVSEEPLVPEPSQILPPHPNPLPQGARELGCYAQDDMACRKGAHLVSIPSPLEGEGVRRTGEGECARRTGRNATNIGGFTSAFARGFTLAEGTPYGGMLPALAKGFTLAEVLITLGIIGIVAAMTMPTLITNYRKHVTESKLAKAVSTLNQVIKLSEQNNASISALDTSSITQEDFIEQYIRPYMKISEICMPLTNCGYPAGHNIWKYLNGSLGYYRDPADCSRVPFIGMDGIMYTFSFHSGADNMDNLNTIFIDINGGKGPNQHGKDVFMLYRRTDVDEISTYGYDKSDAAIKGSCSKTGDGFYCATLIQRNGWKIPKDYPW